MSRDADELRYLKSQGLTPGVTEAERAEARVAIAALPEPVPAAPMVMTTQANQSGS